MGRERKVRTPETAIYTAYEDFQPRDAAEPEKNLMRAILNSALEDIRKRGEPYRDARRYFLSNDHAYLYSFMSVCYHLGLCHKTVRTVLGLNEDRARASEGDMLAA